MLPDPQPRRNLRSEEILTFVFKDPTLPMSTMNFVPVLLHRPYDLAQFWGTIAFFSAVLIFSGLIILVIQSKRAGLSDVPGPWIAQYTDAWNLYSTYKALHRDDKASYHRHLQSKYGNVVRTGPKTVSIFDPAAVPVIYGVRSKLDKVTLLTLMITS